MAQSGPKKTHKGGQKWFFFKYSRIVYRLKAYGKLITHFVNKSENFQFLLPKGPKMAQKWTEKGRNWAFSKHSCVIYHCKGNIIGDYIDIQFFLLFYAIFDPIRTRFSPVKNTV